MCLWLQGYHRGNYESPAYGAEIRVAIGLQQLSVHPLPLCMIYNPCSLGVLTCRYLPGDDLFSLGLVHVLLAEAYALQFLLACMLVVVILYPGFETFWRSGAAPHLSASYDLHCYCSSFALNLIVLSIWYCSLTVSYRLSARRLASFFVMLFTASFHSGYELHSNPLSP